MLELVILQSNRIIKHICCHGNPACRTVTQLHNEAPSWLFFGELYCRRIHLRTTAVTDISASLSQSERRIPLGGRGITQCRSVQKLQLPVRKLMMSLMLPLIGGLRHAEGQGSKVRIQTQLENDNP